MLEQIFGSQLRVDLIKLFLNNQTATFTDKSIAKKVGSSSIRTARELGALASFGLIKKIPVGSEAGWQVDLDFPLIPELLALFVKSAVLIERELSKRIKELKGVRLLVFTGVFLGLEALGTDVLIIGSIDKQALHRLMSHVSKEFGHDLRFTVLSKAEYKQRRDMTDKFLYEILNNRPIVAIDNL